jgi:hypothetical protein
MPLPDLTKLVPIYKSHIDNFINSLGKNVKVVFEPTITEVEDGFNDPVRPGSIKKPVYKTETSEPSPEITENSMFLKALIQYSPKDFENFGIKFEANESIIRLKTFIADVQYLTRCKYIVPNYDSDLLFQQKFKLIRTPMPRGILYDYYAYTYWKSF